MRAELAIEAFDQKKSDQNLVDRLLKENNMIKYMEILVGEFIKKPLRTLEASKLGTG
jgi:hypothetical protein